MRKDEFTNRKLVHITYNIIPSNNKIPSPEISKRQYVTTICYNNMLQQYVTTICYNNMLQQYVTTICYNNIFIQRSFLVRLMGLFISYA
jgi:hypothetical protein